MHLILHKFLEILLLRSCSHCPSYKSLILGAYFFCRTGVLCGYEYWLSTGKLGSVHLFCVQWKYKVHVCFTCKYKGEKPTCFAFRKVLLIWLFSEWKLEWTFFFFLQLGFLIYLVPLMKTQLGVERIYCWGKKRKGLFIILQIRSKDRAFFFLSYLITPGNMWSPNSAGKMKSNLILIGHLS